MRTGYVIPSLGRDLESLEKAIDSVLVQSKSVEIILVAPASAVEVKELAERKNVQVVNDTQKGVANAFNLGIEYLANRGVEIFGVLGEDDFLLPYSMINLLIPFKDHKVQAAVGHIWYINDLGKIVFHNRAFPMLLPILHWIPNVIPHPGSLSRVSAWQKVGGFNPDYKFASDLDYWLKIRHLGKIARVECPMSFFGFGELGSTAQFREDSIREGKKVRQQHSKKISRLIFSFGDFIFTKLGEKLIQRKNLK